MMKKHMYKITYDIKIKKLLIKSIYTVNLITQKKLKIISKQNIMETVFITKIGTLFI